MNSESRKRLATYMMLVSQGWAILPAPWIILPEVESACLNQVGHAGYDLRKLAIKKGLSQMMGERATLVDKDSKHPMPEEEKRRILEKLEGPWGLLKVMEIGFPGSSIKRMLDDSKAEAEKLERIRKSWQSRIRDNNLLRRAIMADYLVYQIGPKLLQALTPIHPDPKAFVEEVTKDKRTIIRFFQSMPTSYCNVQLTIYRDMQTKRIIQPNDMHDIMSLSIAIPYSDVVVTERMWQSAIKQTKLDELYHTIVLRSVKALAPILDSK
jgi:hypothetical protein